MRLLAAARRLLGGAESRARERLAAGEIRWGGAKVFGGLVLDEYNPDLKGRLALQDRGEDAEDQRPGAESDVSLLSFFNQLMTRIGGFSEGHPPALAVRTSPHA